MSGPAPDEPAKSERERTSVAWTRTALAVTVFGIVLMRVGVSTGAAADIAASVAAFGCALALAAVGRREYRRRAVSSLVLIRMTAATAALVGLLTLVAVVLR